MKRWPGYALARAAENPANLLRILSGSEGTLAAITSAELKIVPLPEERGVGLFFFDSVAEAMQATEELLDLKPAAIEHIDRPLFDQTRGHPEFQAARDLMELDAKPCEAILIVEFFEGAKEGLSQLQKKNLGLQKINIGIAGAGQPGLGSPQIRALAAHEPQRRRQAGLFYRGCGSASPGFAVLCERP